MYESERSRRAEREVVEAVYGPCAKLPMSYEVDFAVERAGRVVAVVEVKVRSRQFDTVILALRKLKALRGYASCGLHARLLVALPSGIYGLPISATGPIEVRMGGRTDRADAADVEPVAHLPMASFSRMADARRSWFHHEPRAEGAA